ncbi:hypothetical protein OWV82_009212 [Melia azedarach]|uniref:Uncharacterized protein n=1 Tax=Melia azedarach TaxID=155640 RepID=A0ACC1YCM3_MELAZ|nr:hypothetical protein OWV82_009212 [Melia azedarach]
MQLISMLAKTRNKYEARFCSAKGGDYLSAVGVDCGSLSAVEGADCGGLSADADYVEYDGVSCSDVVESAGLVAGQYVEFGGLGGVECDDVGDGIDAEDFQGRFTTCEMAGAEALACMVVKKYRNS